MNTQLKYNFLTAKYIHIMTCSLKYTQLIVIVNYFAQISTIKVSAFNGLILYNYRPTTLSLSLILHNSLTEAMLLPFNSS